MRNIVGLEIYASQLPATMKRGALWHKTLEVIHNAGTMDNVVQLIKDYEIESWDIQKIKALYTAHCQFIVPDTACRCEIELYKNLFSVLNSGIKVDEQFYILGIIDRLYTGYFVESKLTGKPDFYSDRFTISPQIALYFLLNQSLQYCVMEITRVPFMEPKDGEEPAEYGERVRKDIFSRPKHYFLNLDRDKGMYGFTFYRNEFHLDRLANDIAVIHNEIKSIAECGVDYFYEERTGCRAYGQLCKYYPVCSSDGEISDDIYYVTKTEER
jgi:hypothetical protein